MGKLKHLEMKNAPKKSTLFYDSAHRPWEMFNYDTLDICSTVALQNRSFRFKNKLLSLDSSTISLCLLLIYSLGQNSAEQKALSNFIFFLITMAIYPPVPTFQKAKSMMSRLPGRFLQLFSDIRLRIWEFAQI